MKTANFNKTGKGVLPTDEYDDLHLTAPDTGEKARGLAFWMEAGAMPLLTLAIMIAATAIPAFAQTNPFPTRGDQSLGNLVSGTLSILSWLALAAGIGSFSIIPIKLFMKSEWMNYVWAGLTGVGAWGIMGSLAYLLANNQTPNLPGLGQ